ncbi:MAG: transglutaminase [Ruminiclostridium sp.]|nr:transglutaminase [Ruminiclostridium sp.]
MGKGKVIGAVAAAVAVPAAVVVGAIYILPALGISSSNTLYYFGNDTSISADGTISLSKEDVLGYSSKYSDTMTGYFKEQLDENETYIYNAFMYASENGYSDVFLPEEVFDNGSYDRLQELEYVITFLSCDSPFVAHNYTTDNKLSGNVEQFAGKSYHHIQLETLGKEYTSRREAAYEKAKSVVASIPSDCDTQKQKAQYLYDYVAENSVYVTDGYSTRNIPIADLLIDGKAICDGYADTVTMLFNMAGIETASANGVNTEKNQGHTVNFAKLDGEYYYFDASADSIINEKGFKPAFYFGMSWEEVSDSFTFADEFANRCPKAEKSLLSDNVDIVISDNSDTMVENMAELLKSGGDTGIIVRFDESVTDEERKSITSDTAGKVGEQLASISAANRLYGIKIYKE